jgi:hypothetical protein
MGRIACVTTFSEAGYEVYGRTMLETFDQFWPEDIDLYVYYEGEKPKDASERAIWYPLDQDRDRRRFMAIHTDDPINYRRQPIKFCHKVFAVTSVPRQGIDWLIWLDGDIVTTAPVTHEFLSSIMPDVTATYLGRRWWAHTEAGFLAYNLNKGGALLLDDMRRMYTSNQVMTLFQQHDCAVFDYCRQSFEHQGAKFLDLGEGFKGPSLDVMSYSVLKDVLRHNKGLARKLKAYGAVA